MSEKHSDQKHEQQNLFTFPCDFPIKIMGDVNAELEKLVHETLHQHVQNPKTIKLNTRHSKDKNFISITAIFEAHSKEQLDTLYLIFSKHPAVKMVL